MGAGRHYPTIPELREAQRCMTARWLCSSSRRPPQGYSTLGDFRQIAVQLHSERSAALHTEYRRADAQRDALLELAKPGDEAPERAWRLKVPDGDEALAERAREHLRGQTSLRFPQRAPTSTLTWVSGPRPWRSRESW